MPEIGTSGSMSGDGKRGVAEWPKLPRPSSTLPASFVAKQQYVWNWGQSGNAKNGPITSLMTRLRH